jgi:hypothetical protein
MLHIQTADTMYVTPSRHIIFSVWLTLSFIHTVFLVQKKQVSNKVKDISKRNKKSFTESNTSQIHSDLSKYMVGLWCLNTTFNRRKQSTRRKPVTNH